MLESVTIEQLRVLRAVAEEGSFSAAARKLGRVQAAVSQSIERLEAALNLRLFDRSGRVPRLTRHGEAVVAAATTALGDVAALEELVLGLKRGAETSLAIVVDALFPTESLVVFVKELAAEHPSVELVLFTETLSAVTELVRSKRAAWGVAVEDADLSGLNRRRVAEIRLVPVAAAAHPLARIDGAINPATLSRAVQIVMSERRREDAAPSPEHGVLSPRTWRVVNLATKQALIQAGLGFGHMPEHLVRGAIARGELRELSLDAWGPEGLTRELVVVSRRGAVPGPVARWAEARLTDLCRRAIDAKGESAKRHHTR